MPFEDVIDMLSEIDDKDIIFSDHFYEKAEERPISEELVRSLLHQKDALLHVEQQRSSTQEEQKYKLWLRMSNRYSLVVVAAVRGKSLYIITAWNTERRWRK